MRKIYLLFICFCISLAGFSQHQELDKNKALELVKSAQTGLGFSDLQLKDLKVAQSYSDPSIAASYIYLQQTLEGVPIHNKIIVLAFKNGKLISRAGTFVENAATYSNGASVVPAITAEMAITSAAQYTKAGSPGLFIPRQTADGKIHYGTLGIAYEDVTAQLLWLPLEKAGTKASLRLVWQILLAPDHTTDMWYIRVDAQNNSVINKDNLTVYENLNEHATDGTSNHADLINEKKSNAATASTNSPSLVNTANYLVIPYPVESPLYGAATTVSNPWTMAGTSNPNATTLRWHNDGVSDYTISRGNNVWATEDRLATNLNTGLPATSSTVPDPLNFIFPPDYTVAPTDPLFQQFAITNLFYWNNIMHDMYYNYGFNEVSGNFQASNMGRGAAGNDHVLALAQSGAGSNNANFSTPPDGARGRMRMYLFTAPNPDRDGDLDNGIIAHEYGHGISNRLTGGIAGAGGCLSNSEQGGEGWSDYMGLMVTTNWATAQVTDGFNIRRPVGNYVLNVPVTNRGIRNYPYSTDLAVNPLTYAHMGLSGGAPWILGGGGNEVHNIGEIWCAALWDMTWNIIQTNGINPNLFNAAGTGGNSIALKLVVEGMRLQPCSPGFIDSRNAILQADQLLYGGLYRCAILSAFARRGMGTDARQGSSGSTTDHAAGFSTVESTLILTQNLTQQQEGLSVIYTNKVTAGSCGAIANYLLTDTLPTNVTYVSGGTYNAANRVVSFSVNLAAGAIQNYSFTVMINAGTYFPAVTLFQDVVPGPAINPAIWSVSSTTATNWVLSSARSHTPPSSYYSLNTINISDQRLFSAAPIVLGATPPKLTFWHWFNTESNYDGGILEISTDGGTVYNYVPQANMLRGGYNTAMDASTVLVGKTAWSGNSGGFIRTTVNLAPYANQSIKLRFRSTTDNGTALEGWYVDDIEIKDSAVVDMRSSLFNGSGVRVQISDTFTIITPATTPVITSQPGNAAVCEGSNASFTVLASGTGLSYQWQVSTAGAGGPWANLTNAAPYSGVMTNTLTITAATASMNNYQYRVIVTNTNGAATSTSAILTVTSVPSSPGVTTPVVYCQGATATPLTATGTNLLWYTAATGGTGSSTAPTPSTATAGSITYYVSQTTGCESPRAAITVTVNATPAAPVVTTPITYCQGSAATPLTATGTNLLWYTVATGGTGSTTAPTPSTATVGSTTFYVSQTTGTCEGPRAAIVVNVTASTPAPGVTSPVTYCQGGTAVPLTATGTNLMWYTVSTGGTGSTTAPTPSTATVGSTLYYVSQTTSCGEGPRASITVNVTAPPAAPVVTTPVIYCQGATAVPLTPTGSNLLWYTVSTGGTGSATAPTPSSTTVGSTTYYVSQTVGCESPRAAITVTVNSTPAAPGVTSPITYCQGATAVPLTATGTNLKYYTVPTGGTGTATAPTPSTATVGSTTYYVSQTTGVCEGPRAAIVVNVIAGTTAPGVATPVNYCQGAAASPLTATGTGLLYYTVATGGPGSSTAPTPSTATAGSITYYVSQTVAPCGEGPRAAITVTVAALPSAPAVSSPVTYCQGATAVPLTATSTGLLYYTAPTGGAGSATAPTPSTAAVGSTTYYVSQAAGSCEGARAAIVVNVTSTPAVPVVTAAASYCQGGTAIPLTATGTNLLYYTTATGGTGTATAPTPSTATIGTTVYYVSQSTGICEGPRAAITVTITAGAAITVQPADITSCSTTATFSVTATGTTLGYQWQVSTDGGTTYNNIGGALSNVLTLNNLTAATANYKYRVIVSAASCGSVTSNAVTAKVGTAPVVVLTAAPFTAYNPSITGGLYTTVSPAGVYTYQWTRDGVVLPNVTVPSITAANGLLFEFGAYKVTVTDPATGCAGVSNTVTITDVAGSRNQLFITPNPARDIVRISYYSTVTAAQARKINVYDSKGGKIMVKDFTVTGRYGTMNLDLSRMIQGTYMIIVRDAAGNKIASESIIKL